MSQPSINEQVKDLKSSGFPVREGVRMNPNEHPDDIKKFGSALWLVRWAQNAFKNYPIVSRALGAKFLHESCHGMPCFVVGVGPSLDESIAELKAAQGRSIIIATDAALRALLANGITPDLVVSYDCKEDQKRLWETVAAAPPCMFNSCTHPESIASWPGPVLFFNQYHTQDDLCKTILPSVYPNLGQIPSAGTVGNMATLVAHLMGCTPICLVGMDFCYQPASVNNMVAWRYRAQDYRFATNRGAGIPDGWEKTEIKELYDNDDRIKRSFMVKGESGKDYRSDPELSFYLDAFRDIMADFKVPVVNCTPNGRIPSTLVSANKDGEVKTAIDVMTIPQVIEKFCKREYQGGRNVLAHLAKIAADPRKQPEPKR
jgi:6-hydroxymethylpterin diphosphokinase MptE-like protein